MWYFADSCTSSSMTNRSKMIFRNLILILFSCTLKATLNAAEQGPERMDLVYEFSNSRLKQLEESLTAKMEEQNQRIEKQSQKIEEQNQRIEKQNQKIEEQNQRIEKQNQKIEEQNQKIHVLEQKVDYLTLQLQEKQTEQTQVQVSLESVRNEVKLLSLQNSNSNPRTCEDIRTTDPLATSGMYFIDPDGYGTGDSPFQVFCNMTTGGTEVLHDSESAMEVSHCSDPGCYSRPIRYEATARQMGALISLSNTCRQHIQYDCVSAPLHFNDYAYAWWNDRNGSPQYYWAGSSNTTSPQSCQCGTQKNCVDPATQCNCDSGAPEPLTDQGYINDMTALPVTQLNFGRILYSQSSGVHRLGRLECFGKTLPTTEPSSCEDLWKYGHVLPAIFAVKDQGKLKAVYCDFTKLPGEQGFQKDFGIIDVQSTPVYFHVYRNSSYATADSVIPFPETHINMGGAVDSSGVFTAPVAGIYHFQFFGRKIRDTDDAFVRLRRDFTVVSSTYTYTPAHEVVLSTSATLDLDAGETVSTYLMYGSVLSDPNKYTFFTGMLLQQRQLP